MFHAGSCAVAAGTASRASADESRSATVSTDKTALLLNLDLGVFFKVSSPSLSPVDLAYFVFNIFANPSFLWGFFCGAVVGVWRVFFVWVCLVFPKP